MKRIVLTSVVLLSLLTSVGCSKHKEEAKVTEPVTTEQTTQDNTKLYKEAGLLTFRNEKQLELGELDSKSRATYAHIQLKDSDEPKEKREAKLTFDPVGWHNYKFYYGDGTKEAWLMNRGHLVGYQFSGLNDEGRNLVPMTAWLNTGAFTGTDDKNQSSMLYYENGLDSWLANHPNYYLDYKVTAVYKDDELIPRQIILQYVGIDQDGKLLEIKLGSSKEKIDKYSVTHVALDNVSANAEINYADGTAKNTVKSAEERAAELKAAEEKAKKEAEEKEAQEKAKKEMYKLLLDLYENELKYTQDIYGEIGLYDEVKDYVEYNANRALANLGYPGYFEDKDINPIIENAMNTSTKNHDFFSVKGDGYVVSMNVESIEDEDFIFE